MCFAKNVLKRKTNARNRSLARSRNDFKVNINLKSPNMLKMFCVKLEEVKGRNTFTRLARTHLFEVT